MSEREYLPAWAPWALAIQLVLVFFAPSLSWGERHVFLSDIWCVLWLAAGLLDLRIVRASARFLGATALLVAIVYAHGYFRVTFTKTLIHYYYVMKEGDEFKAGRELVVAARFLSWLWAGQLVASWFADASSAPRARAARRFLGGVLLACVAVASLSLVADALSEPARYWLAGVYGFDPKHEWWLGRACGVFGSPLEAGAALALAGLLLNADLELSRQSRWAGLLAAVPGLLASKTVTAMAAAVFGWLGAKGSRWKRLKENPRKTYALLALGAVLIAVAGVAVVLVYSPVAGKLADIKFRFLLWGTYFQWAARRLDVMLLGFGFAPFHVDNFYVFLFTRGGIALLVAVLAWFGRKLWRQAEAWGPANLAWILFLLISGLVLDVVIYRHVVSLLLAVGIPGLTRRVRGLEPVK